ncbi:MULTISPECIES: hypothetical protein [Haloarcula]|uniref:Uncharacterized protein n=1 Tax=Haloarcula pellucida TaxID=1427151 RepID=A0A830GIW0_9EURY|nr:MULTISPECIES: hypothetical protein [Halomicroarcula]MBX0347565.1 hypothetical protein [Halomicroarcula pellucida]MDS0276515.1 hypothetical protein [Halomicroarcula sp. S1AR25-4]GGN89330.1 hypothetical protein GCM10009030_09900 [Halomicroarcula pellucida]
MPSSMNDRTLRAGLAVFSVLVLAYSLVIVQQILLGLLVIAVLWSVYLFYHFILVLARIASSLEQLAYQRADGGRQTQSTDRSSEREPEREY